MKINQLFKKMPDETILNKIINAFGLNSLNDNRGFTRADLIKLNTIENLYEMKNDLLEYYIPCKARNYLNDLNEKNAITILRQFVKVYNFKVISSERNINKTKYIYYKLVPTDQLEIKPIFEKIEDENNTVNFD